MKALFIFTAIHVFVLVAAAPTSKVVSNDDLTWYCKTICDGCRGDSNYDTNEAECICKIHDDVSDEDTALVNKISQSINLKFKLVDTRKGKRDAEDDESEENDISETTSEEPEKSTLHALFPLRMKLRSRLLNIANETDPLLGKSNILDTNLHHNALGPMFNNFDTHHNGILGPHLLPYHHYPLDTHRNALMPTASDTLKPALTKAMLTNIRKRIDHLIDKTDRVPYDHRRTAHEAESLRNSLKQLSQINVNARSDAPMQPFWKNSLFGGGLPGFGLLGQAAPSEEVSNQSRDTSDEGNSQEDSYQQEDTQDIHETNSKIITQPENLIGNSEEDASEDVSE